MTIRKRIAQASYLKVTEGFELLGTGFTALDEKPSAKTSSKRYINSVSATQSVTGYEWSTDFETDEIVSDKAIEYITDIGRMLRVGADAETEYVIVDLDKTDGGAGKYKARKINVAIAVSDFKDNDGELGCSGSFVGQGDMVEGTFDTKAKTFTPKQAAE
jgi:hypothetical protein